MSTLYNRAEKNETNLITYFDQNKKCVKTFKDFSLDVKKAVRKVSTLGIKQGERIALFGYTSYDWMVLDHACILGGFQSVAIPETYSFKQQEEIVSELKVKWAFVSYTEKNNFVNQDNLSVWYFNCADKVDNNFNEVLEDNLFDFSVNKILKDYTIVFSSGTSEKLKYINRVFFDLKRSQRSFSLLKKLISFFTLKGTVWGEIYGKKNKIIVFLPFSHPMQRDFARICLGQQIDIVLSDPQNCIKHIMTEKPNIMISVPPIYDALALLIKARIAKFNDSEKELFSQYILNGINKRSNKDRKKRWFQERLFGKLRKVYGGHADLFVSGSAPIKKETLEIFYNVGVKIYEAYGQSELSTTIMNSPKHFRIGSIGKPNKNKVKLSSENEILVRFQEKFDYANIHVLKVEDGFIRTGDIGYFDNDGFLFVKGRLDDVIVLKKGKKVHPKKIESMFFQFGKIKNVCVYSEDKMNISAIVFSKSLTEFELSQCIKTINVDLVKHEKIIDFTLVVQEPSVENGLLTGTMKLKRKEVVRRFSKKDLS